MLRKDRNPKGVTLPPVNSPNKRPLAHAQAVSLAQRAVSITLPPIPWKVKK
ncbi:MAG: hypothetical protein [Arizlama microvirus]|nr:MAG: hypothetical protein [Arizlama microvirus]